MPSIGTASSIGFQFITTAPDVDPEFPNGDFDNGLVGWTPINQSILWGGKSIVGGFPTPPNPLPFPYGSPGEATGVYYQSFTTTLEKNDVPPGGVQAARLTMDGSVNNGASLYGPALVSNGFVSFNAGDLCVFQWKALSLGDAYNIFAYLVEKTTGAYITLIRAAASSSTSTAWITQTLAIPISGDYKFVFVSGGWDSTYGGAIAAALLVDNIKRVVP